MQYKADFSAYDKRSLGGIFTGNGAGHAEFRLVNVINTVKVRIT